MSGSVLRSLCNYGLERFSLVGASKERTRNCLGMAGTLCRVM